MSKVVVEEDFLNSICNDYLRATKLLEQIRKLHMQNIYRRECGISELVEDRIGLFLDKADMGPKIDEAAAGQVVNECTRLYLEERETNPKAINDYLARLKRISHPTIKAIVAKMPNDAREEVLLLNLVASMKAVIADPSLIESLKI